MTIGIQITESFLFGFRYFDATEEIPEREFQVHITCFCLFFVFH